MKEENKKSGTPVKEIDFKTMRKMSNTFKVLLHYHPEILNTKFGRAYLKLEEENIQDIFTAYNREVKSIEIDNALEDKETGAILFEDPQKTKYKYSKESLKEQIKQENDLFDNWKDKTFKVETRYFVGEYPEYMSELQKELFTEYVLAKK